MVSSSHELPFVRLNILESSPHVDRILICEADYSHVGHERELLFEKLLGTLNNNELRKVEYIPLRIGHQIDRKLRGAELFHSIERIIRDEFARIVNIHNSDFVVAVDADEIIYSDVYPMLKNMTLGKLGWKARSIRLKLHQFFFFLDYLWEGHLFDAPVATRASVFLSQNRPADWRYLGKTTKFHAGVHFSWVMNLDDMVSKLSRYAHNDLYGHLADEDLLLRAMKEKRYIFDSQVDFTIKEISYDNEIYPRSFKDVFTIDHPWFSTNN